MISEGDDIYISDAFSDPFVDCDDCDMVPAFLLCSATALIQMQPSRVKDLAQRARIVERMVLMEFLASASALQILPEPAVRTLPNKKDAEGLIHLIASSLVKKCYDVFVVEISVYSPAI